MDDEQRITKVEKEKDPRRVEAGKRLAAISRAAKERKAKQRSEAEQTTSEELEPAEGYSVITVLTGVGVLTGLVCLYFTYRVSEHKHRPLSDPIVSQERHPNSSRNHY